MEILVDGKVYQAEPDANGKVTVTFTKNSTDDIEVKPLANCQGTTLLDNIQLEQGNKATAYEEPNILIDGQPTGLIKDLRDLEYALHSPNGVKSSITQLRDSVDLKVSNRDLLSQINIQANGILIQSGTNKLNITPDTTYIENGTIKSAMIKDLAVDKITGTSAEFTTMVTRGLTADVISSNMINANEALFDKLFSNSMATTKLSAQDAWIKNANIASLDASKITSGTIATARLDAGAIVTNGLSADVVKSSHIQAGTALVDKIFAQDAYITRLTGKTAFISSIQAVNLSASRITSGTLDASKATITNIDANSITANKTSFVQSAWNGVNNTVSINASGIRSTATNGDWTLYHSGAISFGGGGSSQGIYLEYADGSRNGLAINNRGATNTDITLDLVSSARNTMNFGRRTDTNGYDFRIDHYQGTKVSFDGRGIQRYTFNVNSDSQSHAISILGHGATSGYNSGSGISIGLETADGITKGSRFYFSSASDLVWLGKDSYSDLKPLAVFDIQFRWGQNGRKSMKDVLEYLSRASGVDINNIPDV